VSEEVQGLCMDFGVESINPGLRLKEIERI